jgi:hypothetical protein
MTHFRIFSIYYMNKSHYVHLLVIAFNDLHSTAIIVLQCVQINLTNKTRRQLNVINFKQFVGQPSNKISINSWGGVQTPETPILFAPLYIYSYVCIHANASPAIATDHIRAIRLKQLFFNRRYVFDITYYIIVAIIIIIIILLR